MSDDNEIEKVPGVLVSTKLLPHEERTQRFAGKKGTMLAVSHRVYCLFKIDRVEATDTFNGRATEIRGIFVGADTQCIVLDAREPGVLSVDFKLIKPMTMALPVLDISFSLRFLEDAEWWVTLSGRAVKEDGDTRESMREREVRKWEQSILRTNPKAADDLQFQQTIQRMLEYP